MRRALAATVTVTLAAIISGCSGGTSLPMSKNAAIQLAGATADVRTTIQHGDRSGTDQALAHLRALVATLQPRGEITNNKANTILDAIASLQNQLTLLPT